MNKVFMLSILLLPLHQRTHAEQNDTPEVHLTSSFLEHIDGTRIVNMGHIMATKTRIHSILTRQVSKDYTFKGLVSKEADIPAKQRDAILHKFIHQFSDMTRRYFDDLLIIKEPLVQIMEQWIVVRNNTNSKLALLINKIHNKNLETVLLTEVKTLHEFDIFLEDLHLFLHDLSLNLPKSLHLYRLAEQKNKDHAEQPH